MNTNINNPLLKQLAGGLLGMALATGAYFAVQYTSQSQVTALLVGSDQRVSTNAGQVSVNDKNVDPAIVARLAAQAKQVTAQLNGVVAENVPKATQSPMEDRTMERLARRQQLAKYAAVTQPVVQKSTINSPVAPVIVGAKSIVKTMKPPVKVALASQPAVSAQVIAVHSGAPLEHPKRLGQSGIDLQTLALFALVATSSVYLLPLRKRAFAMVDTKN